MYSKFKLTVVKAPPSPPPNFCYPNSIPLDTLSFKRPSTLICSSSVSMDMRTMWPFEHWISTCKQESTSQFMQTCSLYLILSSLKAHYKVSLMMLHFFFL